jgi:hypothetical protein
MIRKFAFASARVAIAFSATLGCSSGYEGPTVVVDTLPSAAGFDSVATPLVYFCGSLDCHGATGRNLRLYGKSGLRLDPNDVPCGAPTSEAEVEADYRSVTGLEPEILGQVAKEGGAHPERLTLIRKARGTEKHTGGEVFKEGSDGDQCLLDWIAGSLDELIAACNNTIPQNPTPQCIR